MKEAVKKVFDDLDEYRNFCREYGRVFNESHLYKEKTPYDEFLKWKDTGKARQWPGYPFNQYKKRFDNKRHDNRDNRDYKKR
mgnify:FL=1